MSSTGWTCGCTAHRPAPSTCRSCPAPRGWPTSPPTSRNAPIARPASIRPSAPSSTASACRSACRSCAATRRAHSTASGPRRPSCTTARCRTCSSCSRRWPSGRRASGSQPRVRPQAPRPAYRALPRRLPAGYLDHRQQQPRARIPRRLPRQRGDRPSAGTARTLGAGGIPEGARRPAVRSAPDGHSATPLQPRPGLPLTRTRNRTCSRDSGSGSGSAGCSAACCWHCSSSAWPAGGLARWSITSSTAGRVHRGGGGADRGGGHPGNHRGRHRRGRTAPRQHPGVARRPRQGARLREGRGQSPRRPGAGAAPWRVRRAQQGVAGLGQAVQRQRLSAVRPHPRCPRHGHQAARRAWRQAYRRPAPRRRAGLRDVQPPGVLRA